MQLITSDEKETICRKGHCFFVTQLWAVKTQEVTPAPAPEWFVAGFFKSVNPCFKNKKGYLRPDN